MLASAAQVVSAANRKSSLGRSLSDQWREIARSTDGVVGAAALWLDSGRTTNLNGGVPCPLASVCKLPLAMNIFALADEGRLRLDQQVEVLDSEIWPPVSDIAKEFPARRSFELSHLLEVMVAHSDNTAEETIYRIGGGAAAMAARFREWKIDGVRIDRSERECDRDRNRSSPEAAYRATLQYLADPRDTGTANGTVQLLARLYRGELLSKASTARLIEILKSTSTGPMRLKGLLPAGTVVAHKTGTTGVIKRLAAATNDSGIMLHPKRGAIAISIYVRGSTKDEAAREGVIARIARAAYDSQTKDA